MAEPQKQYVLEIFSDTNFVRDIVKGVLHTIFFHRYFPSIRPSLYQPSSQQQSYTSSRSSESLPIPLPAIFDPPEIAAEIDSHVAILVSQLTSPNSTSPGSVGSRGEVVVQFMDRRKRRVPTQNNGWFGRLAGQRQADTEEEVCWEEWVLSIVVARPRSEADRIKVRRAMESSLQKAAMKIVSIVSRDKEHVPPIVTNESNPFPWKILVNPR